MTGRRGNHEGSISQRGDGRFMYRWTDQTGRRRTGYAKTRPEAVKALREALERVENGEAPVESPESFQVVAERWRQTAKVRQGIKTNSLATYSSALRLHAYPVIGSVRMRDLKPSHIAQVLARMEDLGLSASYRHVVHKAISGVCEMAVVDELMRTNPARKISAPKGVPTTKVVPDRAQVLALIEAAPNERIRTFIVVLAYTGLRISEALSLRWSDWQGDTLRAMTTKGDKPRAIPVAPALAEQLKRWRKDQAAEQLASPWWDTDHDWILSTAIGTQWDGSNARKQFRSLCEGDPDNPDPAKQRPAICPGATPHSLRHATATILLEQGVPMKVVSELLGHADMRTTSEIYSHVTARLLTEAATALGDALAADTNRF